MWPRSFFVLSLSLVSCAGTAPEAQGPAATPSDESSSSAEAASDPKSAPLLLASGVWSPFTDEAGNARVAIDLVHEALRRAGTSVKTTIVPPSDLMPALQGGTFQGSEALWLTDERREYLLYSEPYLENRLVLLARKGTSVSAKSVSELVGKKVGVVSDYAYGPKILETGGPTLVEGSSDESNLRALLKDELDYIIVDELLVYFLFQYSKEAAEGKLTAGTHPLATRSLYFAVRRDRASAQKIIDGFNQQIAVMKRDGTYNRLLNVAWLVADVDGDGQVETVPHSSHASSDPPDLQYHLSGATQTGAPRFMIEGEVYSDWNQVPDAYKVPKDEPVDRFTPGINAVLLDF